jgi:hypothetical protein
MNSMGAVVSRANELRGLDFEVERASADEILVGSFVDDPPPHRRPNCRLRFREPLYVQLLFRFSGRQLAATRIKDLVRELPAERPWELAASQPTLPALPGVSIAELRDAAKGELYAFFFVDHHGQPSDPPLCIIASGLVIEDPLGNFASERSSGPTRS